MATKATPPIVRCRSDSDIRRFQCEKCRGLASVQCQKYLHLAEAHRQLNRKFDNMLDVLTNRIGKLAEECNTSRERVKELDEELCLERERRFNDKRRLGDYYLHSCEMDWPPQPKKAKLTK